MIIHNEPIEFYINKLKNGEYFSNPGFSDAEWLAMEKTRIRPNENNGIGNRTGGGQLYTEEIGDALREAFEVSDENYYKMVPAAMYEENWVYGKGRMKKFMDILGTPEKDRVFYERDQITDDLAKEKGLNPLIKQLRVMDTVFISNKFIRNIKYFMPYKHFIEIPKLDVYEEEGWLNKYTKKVLDYGKPAVYIFSAGFAAAPFIGRLHGKIPNSFFLDLGSMWDCFCGIGNQRGWRQELYANQIHWWDWIETNLEGIEFDKVEAFRSRDEGFTRTRIKDLENG